MKTADESKADRPAANDEIRASRLARRAWWSLFFGILSFAPLAFLFTLVEVVSVGRFVRDKVGLNDYLSILIGVGPTIVFALLAIGVGLAAASRDNTRNRPLALAGLIFGGLALDGFLSCFSWLLDERLGLLVFVLVAGVLVWVTVVVDIRAGWVRRLRDNPAKHAYDEVLEHRLLRRAQWSVVLGILAAMVACLPFVVKFLEDNAAFDLPSILYYFEGEFVLGVAFGSMGLGFLAGILASTACQRRGMSGNSLAWTGIFFGILAIGISVCAGWAVYLAQRLF